MSTRPNVLIFGTGAVGSVYAYIFQQAGCDVTAVCRSNYEAAKENGFYIDSKKYGDGLRSRPKVIRTPAEAGGEAFDYVIVTTKTFPGGTSSAAELIRPAVGRQTTIALLQNGIGIEEEYAQAYPGNTIISAVVYLPTTQTSPGHVSMGDVNFLEIGTYPGSKDISKLEMLNSFRELLESGGGEATVFEDVQVKRWSKLLVNAGWNPVCALGRSRDVAVLESSSEAEAYVKSIMMEVAGIAQALGYVSIDEKEADRQLSRAKGRVGTRGIEPSMMADALNGRRMEVEAIIGNAMRLGRDKGVKVERLEGLYVLAKALDSSIAASREN